MTKTNKERIIWMDAVRVIAVLMVVIIHSPLPTGEPNIFLSIYNYLSASSIGLFFMISGALLLPVKDSTTTEFYKKRLTKVGYPLIIWSLFYILIHTGEQDLSLSYIFKKILLIPFKPVEGVLWFIYSLVGLYLISPIITPWLKTISQRTLLLILSFWAITLFYPYINIIITGLFVPEYSNGTALSYVNPLFYFGGYIGYFLLGFYLSKYPLNLSGKHLFISILTFTAFAIILPGLIYIGIFDGVKNSLVYGYLTINMAILALFFFTTIQNITFNINRVNTILIEISKMSFGIYLLHIFILRDIVWHWFNMVYIINPALQIPLMAIITLTFSYVIIKLISFIPGSKYIIGI